MSHKGSRSRVTDRKAWDECPLWNKKKTDIQKGLITKEEHLEKEGELCNPIDIIEKIMGKNPIK